MLWDGAAAERAGEGLGCRDRRHDQNRLIQRLAAANPYLYARDIGRIVDVVFEQIGSALAHGDRVELRGFGVFSIRARGARVGRNPRTGDEVAVPSKVVPHFKPGKELHVRLNPIN